MIAARALLVSLAPLVILAQEAVLNAPWTATPKGGISIGAVLLLLIGARAQRALMRGCTIMGLAAFVLPILPVLQDRPGLTLLIGLVSSLIAERVWRWSEDAEAPGVTGARVAPPHLVQLGLRASALPASLGLVLVSVVHTPTDPMGIVCGVALLCTVWWYALKRLQGSFTATQLGLGIGGLLLASVGFFYRAHPDVGIGVMTLPPLLLSMRRPVAPSAHAPTWWESLLGHPAQLLTVTFLFLCLGGTLLLSLPIASATGVPIRPVDAAFTAVSAVCVTGLIVLDTPVALSSSGQFLLLIFIQVGGLGIMTFSTAALALLGRRLSLKQEAALADLFSEENRTKIFGALRRTISVTFGVEALGALVLSVLFWRAGDPIGRAIWRATFTAISAFCNAGFALQSESLVPYGRSPAVLYVISALIIAGGLSPVAILSLAARARRRSFQLSVQVKVILLVNAVLWALGFFAFVALEWNVGLAKLAPIDRVHNALFQSITLRTAGFNSIDYSVLGPATLTLMMLIMLVGGSPGGTAGGIKTTTIYVLCAAVAAAIRGRSFALAFGRKIPHRVVYRAAAVASAGVGLSILAFLAVVLTQRIDPMPALFEVVSALATVGLSVGATGALDPVGKVIVLFCMFLGRVGPLTIFLVLSERHADDVWERPETELEVG